MGARSADALTMATVYVHLTYVYIYSLASYKHVYMKQQTEGLQYI